MKKQKEKEPKEINLDFEIQMGSQIIAPPPVERGIDRNYTMINDLIGFPSPLRYPEPQMGLHWGSNDDWDTQGDWDDLSSDTKRKLKAMEKPLKIFKINKFIELRLDKYIGTLIYIKKERFMQCKYLLFQIPNKEIKEYNKINSIDEAKEYYDSKGELNIYHNREISFEEEFWGHCSNLQVWYEHNYDSRLLHSNLSFPLLKKLTKVGDSLAKKMFKEEIIERLLAGYWPVAQYLIEEKYLDFFTREEQEILIKDIKKKYATHASHSYFIDTFIKKTKISDFSVKDIVSGEDISNDITITVNPPEEVGDIFIQDEGYFNIQEKFSIKKLFTKKYSNKMREDQLKKLYDKYIRIGRIAITEIKQEFNLNDNDLYSAIKKAIKLFGEKSDETTS